VAYIALILFIFILTKIIYSK